MCNEHNIIFSLIYTAMCSMDAVLMGTQYSVWKTFLLRNICAFSHHYCSNPPLAPVSWVADKQALAHMNHNPHIPSLLFSKVSHGIKAIRQYTSSCLLEFTHSPVKRTLYQNCHEDRQQYMIKSIVNRKKKKQENLSGRGSSSHPCTSDFDVPQDDWEAGSMVRFNLPKNREGKGGVVGEVS